MKKEALCVFSFCINILGGFVEDCQIVWKSQEFWIGSLSLKGYVVKHVQSRAIGPGNQG